MLLDRREHAFGQSALACRTLFVDASPQWKRQELYAATIDTITAQSHTRRLLPVLQLPPALFALAGKATALLWMMWLCFGPSYLLLRAALDSITFINTDMGAERGIVDLPDILPQFMQILNPYFDTAANPDGEFLFPFALQVQGWKHVLT